MEDTLKIIGVYAVFFVAAVSLAYITLSILPPQPTIIKVLVGYVFGAFATIPSAIISHRIISK